MQPLRLGHRRGHRTRGGRLLNRVTRLGLAIALLVILADQGSKALLVDMMAGRGFHPLQVTGFFDIVMVWNRGVSFGMMNTPAGAETMRWILVGFAVAVSIGLVVWLRRVRQRLVGASIGLIIGGALANAVDRVVRGAVADFFDIHIAGWHWPAFNVADAAISVGVALLIVDALLSPKAEAGDGAKGGGS